MTKQLEIRLTPQKAKDVACSHEQIQCGLQYLASCVDETGGVAVMTITIQKRRRKNPERRNNATQGS